LLALVYACVQVDEDVDACDDDFGGDEDDDDPFEILAYEFISFLFPLVFREKIRDVPCVCVN